MKLLFTFLFGNHAHLFLPGGQPPNSPAAWSKFILADAQTGGSSSYSGGHVDVKGKGREREWSSETVVGPSSSTATTPRAKSVGAPAGAGHKCEKGFDKGEVVYRCK